ncbi:biotin-dependent carboxyltransferase family protein [Methylobacterium nonmethylotrophicum]|uniref:Biotin-dependent carboxyltransferase family protein n=1 Tax=Methylobacterium nonmethylotrophicum TaxID=1141884 RepID=A0A4Z0NRV6_9HYPH|nr:biotin-dependent carboxyltransferase family protein [Methylobacterium nonmethylotrophicum]TGD99678.1 biotin-dependent carboxyltransferase family protein [Methylobacterium nonmethylotrophicum]
MIRLLACGALATVQDRGRLGALRWGVGTAGAMDTLALAGGNLLVGNPDDAAGIEIQVPPFEIRFEVATTFAVTGADCALMLDGVPILPWTGARARAGAVLRLARRASPQAWGARSYLCVSGGIDVPVVLGSRATQLRGAIGGHQGRSLQAGDELPLGSPDLSPPVAGTGLVPPVVALPLAVDGLPALRVLPAAEYECYRPVSRAAFWGEPWRVTPQSDRYGFRLSGPTLTPLEPLELRSHGIVPGTIQVPHGGQPIVQMCDAQPSGGYPKIGTVIEADLWRLAQAPIGARIRFIETDWDGALAARDALDGWLSAARRALSYLRARSTA